MTVVTVDSFHEERAAEPAEYGPTDGCCLAQLVCCCWCAPARLCCRWLPRVRESVSTRLAYTLLLCLVTLASATVLSEPLEAWLVEHLDLGGLCSAEGIEQSRCDQLVGHLAVYRICLALASLHVVLGILTLGVSTSASWRAGLHNGFWGPKLAAVIGVGCVLFSLPSSFFDAPRRILMYAAFVGAFLFILIQLVLIVDMSHHLTHKALKRVGSVGGCCGRLVWAAFLNLSPLILYAALVAAHGFLIYRYAIEQPDCLINRVLVGVNIGACAVLSVLNLARCRRRMEADDWRAVLIRCGAILCYMTYLTWSALSAQPQPSTENGDGKGRIAPAWLLAEQAKCGRESFVQVWWLERVLPYASLALMILVTLYSSFKTSTESAHLGIAANSASGRRPHAWGRLMRCAGAGTVEGGQRVKRDELTGVEYSYSFFHFLYFLACLYAMMQLTRWWAPEGAGIESLGSNWASVWVRAASAWAAGLIFALSLLFSPASSFCCCAAFGKASDHNRGILI